MKGEGGVYLRDVAIHRANRLGRDPEAAKQLWAHTEELLETL